MDEQFDSGYTSGECAQNSISPMGLPILVRRRAPGSTTDLAEFAQFTSTAGIASARQDFTRRAGPFACHGNSIR